MLCKNLLPFHCLPVVLLMVSFAVQKLFSSKESHLLLLWLPLPLGSSSQKPTPLRPRSVSLVPMFPFLYFIVSGFMFMANLFWVNFCVWFQVAIQFHSFACGFPVSQHYLLNRLFLLCCIFLAPLLKTVAHICLGLFLGSWFCCIGLCVCFSPSTVRCWLLLLWTIVWSQGVWCLRFCYFFSRLLWLLGDFCGSI